MAPKSKKRAGKRRPPARAKRAGRPLVRVLVPAAVLAVAAALWFPARDFWKPERNVVLIVIDAARRDAFGCYGNPDRPTPNIDAIAADGVRFDQAIAASGWTLPSVASILTGAWPTVHGARGERTTFLPMREELPTAAEVLGGAGFQTMGFANVVFVSPMLGFDRGFGLFDHLYTYNRDYRKADATIDAVLAKLDERRAKSNFVMIHLFDPHLSYDAPEPFTFRYTAGRKTPPPPITLSWCRKTYRETPAEADIRYLEGLYTGEVDFVDAQIGRLVERLEALGIYDDTMLIVTSDHGEEFWDHDGFEHGHTLYDELIRVPLIIKYPASFHPPKKVVDSQVRHIDIMPTVFDWFGLDQPPSFAGRSLTPVVKGETSEQLDAFAEGTLYGKDLIAWRTDRYKYILSLSAGAESAGELYDWRDDPGETLELSTQMPALARRLRAELTGFQRSLVEQAERMAEPEPVDLSPRRLRELKSLGYIR